MQPQLATLSKIGPEIKILSEDLKKVKADFQNIEQYKSEVARLKQRLVESVSPVASLEINTVYRIIF